MFIVSTFGHTVLENRLHAAIHVSVSVMAQDGWGMPSLKNSATHTLVPQPWLVYHDDETLLMYPQLSNLLMFIMMILCCRSRQGLTYLPLGVGEFWTWYMVQVDVVR